VKRTIVLTDDGQRVAVIRPRTRLLAQTAVAMAEVAVSHNDGSVFASIPSEVGEYTFEGFLARDKRGKPSFVNDDGSYRCELQSGDSFVGEWDLKENASPVEAPSEEKEDPR